MATTPNLGLHQWQPGDSFLRMDFNQDFGKLDAAVAAAPGSAHAVGFYQGNNDYTAPRVFNVGFAPSAVLILQVNYEYAAGGCVLAVQGNNLVDGNRNSILTLTGTGFEVGQAKDVSHEVTVPYTNVGGRTFAYIAFR